MTPASRKPYRAPRSRRELAIAVATGLAIVLFAALLVWVFAPDADEPAPVTSTPREASSTSTTSTPSTTLDATTSTTAAGG